MYTSTLHKQSFSITLFWPTAENKKLQMFLLICPKDQVAVRCSNICTSSLIWCNKGIFGQQYVA